MDEFEICFLKGAMGDFCLLVNLKKTFLIVVFPTKAHVCILVVKQEVIEGFPYLKTSFSGYF